MTLKKDLQQLSLDDLKRVRRYARYKRLLHRITTLHPKQMLIPVAMLQIASFAMLVNKSILYAAVANMVIVGIALLPFALRKPERQMIRENK